MKSKHIKMIKASLDISKSIVETIVGIGSFLLVSDAVDHILSVPEDQYEVTAPVKLAVGFPLITAELVMVDEGLERLSQKLISKIPVSDKKDK